ncbi:MAG: metallophosphoesterase [Chloroflexi bacterium]|jgi:Icc-related predicted phosphoesterase|uniref:Metallophosphoesterase n=1 Tax=Candidatus Thermofonsia Clade 3 bacterium TaxID=2364212 RepID=A0A2M8QBJ3_9CHLR|nr:metallophosphoesterase [Candidatus Roseilinea sp. NK_OTU-006]PJF47154.1 MAG: metallophosphoesterase [Candidatus Thermofonsia Clade 3 bacterium]RMG65763.1 MAG: metallophosphoesterase [Chloroflexota bacterium]
MKLLAVSDEVVAWIHSPQLAERCQDVDVVLSCGDLPNDYLEYISTVLGKPCFYVHGNHDRKDQREPEGWINLDLQRYRLGALRLAGLEGSPRYKPAAPFQYTQSDQWLRAFWLARKMAQGLARWGRGADIVISHAPLRGIHDGSDPAHIGFEAFNWLVKAFKPRLWLHGHQHRNYAPMQARETQLGQTLIVNVHPYRVLELPDQP